MQITKIDNYKNIDYTYENFQEKYEIVKKMQLIEVNYNKNDIL